MGAKGCHLIPVSAADDVLRAFENPVAAALLGIAVGVGLLLVSRFSVRFITPSDPGPGLAKVLTLAVVRMCAVMGALFAYHLWAPGGLIPFGIALVAAFMSAGLIEMFMMSGLTNAPMTGGSRERG